MGKHDITLKDYLSEPKRYFRYIWIYPYRIIRILIREMEKSFCCKKRIF